MLSLMDLIVFAFVLAAALGFMSLFVCYIIVEFTMSKHFVKRYMGRVKEMTEAMIEVYEEMEEESE